MFHPAGFTGRISDAPDRSLPDCNDAPHMPGNGQKERASLLDAAGREMLWIRDTRMGYHDAVRTMPARFGAGG